MTGPDETNPNSGDSLLKLDPYLDVSGKFFSAKELLDSFPAADLAASANKAWVMVGVACYQYDENQPDPIFEASNQSLSDHFRAFVARAFAAEAAVFGDDPTQEPELQKEQRTVKFMMRELLVICRCLHILHQVPEDSQYLLIEDMRDAVVALQEHRNDARGFGGDPDYEPGPYERLTQMLYQLGKDRIRPLMVKLKASLVTHSEINVTPAPSADSDETAAEDFLAGYDILLQLHDASNEFFSAARVQRRLHYVATETAVGLNAANGQVEERYADALTTLKIDPTSENARLLLVTCGADALKIANTMLETAQGHHARHKYIVGLLTPVGTKVIAQDLTE